MITPVQSRLLIKTKGAYANLKTVTEEKFGTSKTRGEVIAIPKGDAAYCKELGIKVGSTVYFGKYEDTAPYQIDGEDGYILIKIEEIGGVE